MAPDTLISRWSALQSTLAYIALIAGAFGRTPIPELVGAPAVVLAISLGWPRLRQVARVLIVIGASGAAMALVFAPSVLSAAAASMSRLAALVIAVMLFSSILAGLPDLNVICRRLFAGRPLPRYLSITFGTGFLAIPLNFGAVGVMSGMVVSELKQSGDRPPTRNAARAVLRGFGSASFCSPLSIAIAITLTFLPDLSIGELIALSAPLAVGYLLLGAAFQDHEERPTGAVEEVAGTGYIAAMLRIAGYVAAVCVAVFVLHNVTGLQYARAVAISCLSAVALTLLVRRLGGARVSLPSLSSIGNEVAIMGGSAFLGVLASAVALHLLGRSFHLPVWGYPLAAFAVPWSLFLGGMLGLNPIVIGTLVGGVLGPIWPLPAVAGLGVAMVAGWGITVSGTPYSANSLLLSRMTGYDAHTAALNWNLVLSVSSLLLAGVFAAALTYGLMSG